MDDRPPRSALAAERTTLAWRRSGVAVIAIGFAVARGIPTVGAVPARPTVGVAIAVLGALAFVVSARQAARLTDRPADESSAATIGDLWPVAASTFLVAVGAAVVVAVA